MTYSKSFIRLVIFFATAMLLLCQTAAAALAYVALRAPFQVTALNADTAAPCHHNSSGEDDRTPTHGCQDHCPARDASFETAKIHIPAADTLVLTMIAVVPLVSSIAVGMPHTYLAATATPPPLILMYCRLLN